MGYPQPPSQPPWPHQPTQPAPSGPPAQPGQPLPPGQVPPPQPPPPPYSPDVAGAPQGPQYPGAPPPPPAGWQQPGPYGPAYHQPYGAPPPGGRSSGKTVGLIVGIVAGFVLLLDVGGGLLVWPFGSGGKSPEAAVETYFHALENNDCAAMMDVISEETWRISGATTKSEAIEMCEETFGMAGLDVTLDVKEVRLVSESGDTAVVQATVVVTAGDSTPPVTSTTQYTLRKSGGGWVIEHTELLFEEEGAFD